MNSPVTKAEYFEISKSLSLPSRCPLLERCERRAKTIARSNDWPMDQAASKVGLKKPLVTIIGEGPYKIGGANSFVFGGQCPEVNLFESTVALVGFSGGPTVTGEYDANSSSEKFRVVETGHYSECAEYAAYTTSITQPDLPKSWLTRNYQWLTGTFIALAGVVWKYLH